MPEYATNLSNLQIIFGTQSKNPKLVEMVNERIVIASPQHALNEPLHIDVFEYDLAKRGKATLIDEHVSLAKFENKYKVRYQDCLDLDLVKAHKTREEELYIPPNSVVILGQGSQVKTDKIAFEANSKLVFSNGSSVSIGSATIKSANQKSQA